MTSIIRTVAAAAAVLGAAISCVAAQAWMPRTQTTVDGSNVETRVCRTDPASGDRVCTVSRSTLSASETVPLTPSARRQLSQEAGERERAWMARCKPELTVDSAGIGRYRYAESGCDLAVVSR
jgi:hypothetical protein